MLKLFILAGILSALVCQDVSFSPNATKVQVNKNYELYYDVLYKSTLVVVVKTSLINYFGISYKNTMNDVIDVLFRQTSLWLR